MAAAVKKNGLIFTSLKVTSKDVRKARKKTGLKVEEFATLLGVEVVAVRFWETGNWKPEGAELKMIRLIIRNKEFLRILKYETEAEQLFLDLKEVAKELNGGKSKKLREVKV